MDLYSVPGYFNIKESKKSNEAFKLRGLFEIIRKFINNLQFWMEISLLFDFLNTTAVVIASLVAILGIRSWRKDAKWKRKYELAEEVLSLFYDAKDRIAIIRSPIGYVGEGRTRKRFEDEKDDLAEILDKAYATIERYEREKEPFNRLRSLKYRFMAIYGAESGVPFHELFVVINRIIGAANRLSEFHWQQYSRMNHPLYKPYTQEQFDRFFEEKEKYEARIWSGFDNDEIGTEVELIINKIENHCQNILNK